MATWVLRFDGEGTCESTETRGLLLEELKRPVYTDVFLFSHGWNNDFDAALSLYAGFLAKFEEQVGLHVPPRPFKPVFVGITWPSEWLTFGDGPRIAGAEDPMMAARRTQIAERLATLGTADRARDLLTRASISRAEAEELATIMVPLFADASDDENGDGPRSLTAADLLRAAEDETRAINPEPAADLDDYGSTDTGPAAGPQAASLLDAFDPRTYIRLLSVYQMKDRAGRVGTHGMAPLLRNVLKATPANVHVAGHSYGCKVMLSAVCQQTTLSRPVDSLLLLQPAVSYLCFSAKVPGTNRKGGYRMALEQDRVRSPIVSTYSKKDFPLHETFHLSLRRQADLGEAQIAAAVTSAGDPPSRYCALGGYGPRGAGEHLMHLPTAGTDLPLDAAGIIGLDGSKNLITGHGDVKTRETAWVMHQLVFRA